MKTAEKGGKKVGKNHMILLPLVPGASQFKKNAPPFWNNESPATHAITLTVFQEINLGIHK